MCTKQTSTLPDCAHEQFRYWYIHWRGAHIWSVICINKQTVYIVIQFLYRPCIPNSTGQRNFKNQNLNPITELFRTFDHHLGRIPQIYQLQPLQSTVNATSSVSMGFPTFLDPQEVSRTYGAVPVQEPATPPRVFRRWDGDQLKTLSWTCRQAYRGPPNHFPYEGLVHPITLDLCAAKNHRIVLIRSQWIIDS